MKITCTQENLKRGLNSVSHIASKNTSLPILSNVLIKADKGSVSLTTTNLEIGIRCLVRAKIYKDGSFTVNSKLLTDFINLLPNEKIDLELKDDMLEVWTENQETKMKGDSAEDFPLIPQVVKKSAYTCRVEDLLKAFTQVLFAVSVSETRPEISGVYFNFSENNLTIAATDSYRLAEKKIRLSENVKEEKEVIIPARTIQELFRILSSYSGSAIGEEEPVSLDKIDIYFEENQVLFVFNNIELVSRIIEGQYPNYKQIIPTTHKTKAIVNIAEFVKAAKTASLFSRTGIYDVNLELKDGKITVFSTNSQMGESKSKVNGKIEGDNNKVVINYRYLLDGLQNTDSTDVIFEMIDAANPCVLRPAESLDEKKEAIAAEDYLYIIMPIKQ
ncbi:DNA polymerase III subunit beta [Candidatus Falkowbacteria bacterium]|nr:DNA polymerase III subunit beta [Candidatus Falkowbacteria bacterium]